MELTKEIREHFASLCQNGARVIEALPKEYPAFVIRIPDGYGVAFPVDDNLIVSERFNSCRFHTGVITIDGEAKNYLILRSAFESFRYEFAALCAEFVDPGEQGKNRENLIHDPYSWWKKWKELLGNTNTEKKAYDVIGEMMVWHHKLQTDRSATWSASRMGSHDIECDNESCEVKSTLKRYGMDIRISGQHQLEHSRPLFLYAIRFEESLQGHSIDDMKDILVRDGISSETIEIELQRIGFECGASIRKKRYKDLEKRKYVVDESFPQIVKSSFVGNQFPANITHIEYTIDLEGIDYTTW